MIRPLRRRHRHTVIALGIFVPVVFVLGMAVRKPVPAMDSLPPALATPQKFNVLKWERADLFMKAPVKVELLREDTNAGGFAVALNAGTDFVKPDLIVYWVTAGSKLTDSLPENAVLLGGFEAAALPLPQEATTADGVLVLYSLADNEIVDVSKPARFGDIPINQ